MGPIAFIKSLSRRSASVSDERFWAQFFTRFTSKSGQTITPDSALHVSTVYACVRVLSETIASLPLFVYKRKGTGKTLATDYPLYSILHDSPNSFMTSYEFFEMLMAHALLRGNHYAYKETNGGGQIANLVPLNPDKMKVEVSPDGKIIYKFTDASGTEKPIPPDRIWHTKGLTLDGITGISPISYARDAVGLSLATEEHGSRYFSNAATPSGILTVPGTLKDDARKKLKESWQEAHAGGSNAHTTALLEGGIDWKPLAMSAQDSQFLQTRQFQVEEIARIFRVPAILIGYSDKASTYASAEQFMLSFVVHTIRPWVVRLEKSISKNLIPEKDQKKYFAEFQLAGLLRGDMQSRYTAYSQARQWGWMSANDILRLENMDEIGPRGDIYLQPSNMVEAGKQPVQTDEPGTEPITEGGDNDAGTNTE